MCYIFVSYLAFPIWIWIERIADSGDSPVVHFRKISSVIFIFVLLRRCECTLYNAPICSQRILILEIYSGQIQKTCGALPTFLFFSIHVPNGVMLWVSLQGKMQGEHRFRRKEIVVKNSSRQFRRTDVVATISSSWNCRDKTSSRFISIRLRFISVRHQSKKLIFRLAKKHFVILWLFLFWLKSPFSATTKK